jgi:hypothetical protein
MQVNPNYNMAAVPNVGVKPAGVRGSEPAREDTSFTETTALNQALGSVPDSRQDQVERARQLIDDVNYPPPEGINKIAHLLALNFAAESE